MIFNIISKVFAFDSYGQHYLLEQIVDSKINRRELLRVLETIDPREAIILVLREGCLMSHKRIGVLIGVSGTRIRQIEAKAYRKLRHPLRSRRLRKMLDA